jgi:hypothetical protein
MTPTKLISSNSVVAKVMADNDLQDWQTRISDIQEWIGEALEKISGVHIYGKRITKGNDILTLCDYQACLPCDMYQLNSVAYSRDLREWLPMRISTGTFESHIDIDLSPTYSYTDDNIVQILLQMSSKAISPIEGIPGTLTYESALEWLKMNPNTRDVLTQLLNRGDIRTPHVKTLLQQGKDLQYTLKPGYINCNVRDGYLKLAYSAIPRDDEGYALIPDDHSIKEALYWYVTMKLLYPKWVQGNVSDNVYTDARSMWHVYCQQAYTNLLMPNDDGLRTLQNTWLRILPEIEEHQNFYEDTGKEQQIHNHNYGWRWW